MMCSRTLRILVAIIGTTGFLLLTPLWGSASETRNVEFFEKKIRPVLIKRCYKCHSAKQDTAKGGLRLDSVAALQQGGQSGSAIVAKDAEKSLLLKAIRYEGPEMPPDGRLPERVIADFEKWIEMGAPDPRQDEASGSDETKSPAGRLWSLQPVAVPKPPPVQHGDWPWSDIDRFVLSRLEKEGLMPVRDAEPARLLRRVYFDLIGLPPSTEELDAFLSDPSQEAFRQVVDRLLASPQFGERWGRHWLDVARYAESNGKSRDVLIPQAWRYRDYVIDAFNADVPYDRFITEQLAGDLLPAEDAEERDRLLTATGFLAIGSKTLVGNTKQMDLVDEQIDTVSKSVLGLTVACARCHDHKFDPVPTKDYYSLAGIFLSTDTRFGGGLRGPKDSAGKTKELLVLGPDAEQRIKTVRAHQKELDQLNKEQKKLSKKLKELKKKLPKNWKQRLKKLQSAETEKTKGDAGSPTSDKDKTESNNEQKENETGDSKTESDESRTDKTENKSVESKADKRILEYAELQAEQKKVKDQLAELKKRELPELEFAVGVTEDNKPRDCRIHIGGEIKNKGESVTRSFLSCISLEDSPSIPDSKSGRLELARWMTDPENPLTARVAANRIWLHLFGRGIVGTVDNFGTNGEKPIHPELLDYLAQRLMERDWSTKALIRRIVLSRTYQLSTAYDSAGYAVDPENRLYWRMNRRRLEAEAIRDAMLAASGRLDRNRPEASPVAEIGDGEVGRGLNTKPLKEPFPYRSVYLPIIRGIVPEMLKLFDFPEPSNVKGRRSVTNVPAQSLFLMNSQFVIEQAEEMAQRILTAETNTDGRITLAFKLSLSRTPKAEESEAIRGYLSPSTSADKGKELAAWTSVCQALLAGAEFRFLE